MNPPFFVVGVPRSGTTMLRLALNAHPRIAMPAETHFFPDVYEPYAGKGHAEWLAAVDLFIARCAERFIPSVPDLSGVTQELRSGQPDFAKLLDLPLRDWAQMQGKSRWGEKTPLHIFFSEDIIKLFPAARIVALQRDPRSVVASLNRFEHLSNDTVLNAKLWRDVWTTGRAAMRRAVPAGQLLEVRYEELVEAPEQTLRRICEFLREDYVPEMMNFGSTAHTFIADVLSPKLTGPVEAQRDGWRAHLDQRDVALIEQVCGGTMETLGYQRDGCSPSTAQRCEVLVKVTYADLKQLQHRKERYHAVGYRPFERWRRTQPRTDGSDVRAGSQ